jgi:hypothetical protein
MVKGKNRKSWKVLTMPICAISKHRFDISQEFMLIKSYSFNTSKITPTSNVSLFWWE